METLLNDVWPKVRAQIEDAMLTIVGGAYPLKEEDEQSKKLTELRKRWDGLSGVHFTGLVSQSEVAEIVSNHGFMIYPQSFPETFGISTVESLAYGTPVISGRFGAMEETAIEDGCYLMDYPVDSNILYTFDRENHINHFVNMVVDAYNNEYLWQQKVHGALKVREVCTWDKVALQWRQHLYKKLGLYLSKNDYLEVQRINHRTHEIFNKRWSNPEEWGFYPESEKRIEVIVPFYNASQYLNTCIDSIVSQNYENFHVTLINDASTDEPLKNVNFCKFPEHQVTYITNKERVGALANQVKTIKERVVGNDTIIVLIDGDDALINDNNIFKKINQIYHDGAEMTYGSIWSMADNIPLVAQDYPKSVFEKKSFKDYRFPWNMPYTHLRTFTLGLFNRIDDKFLRDNDGEYFKAGGDSALFYSMIERCPREKCRSIKDILYLYNDKNPINDYKVNSEEQTKNANEVLSRKTSNIIDPNSSEGREIRVALEHATTNHLPPNKRVLIAIPTDRNIHPETFKSIYEQVVPEGYWTHFQHFYGYNVDQVRNLIANYAIINNFDYLFCVDYDIAFPNYTLSRFLTIDQPMVTGLYIQRKPGQHILEVYRNTPHGQLNVQIEDFRDEIEKIDACGLGCCLIKTEVLKSVGYPQFVYHDAIEMSNTISEDVDFCNKVRAKGFDIWADTVVKCRHYGQTVFEVK
jgi:glycosyltransferase involved in cell wall biosynthesis